MYILLQGMSIDARVTITGSILAKYRDHASPYWEDHMSQVTLYSDKHRFRTIKAKIKFDLTDNKAIRSKMW